MQNANDRKSIARRQLLKSAPLAGLAACAAGAGAAAEHETFDAKPDPRDVRLADTDHIRTYYKLARR